MRAHHVALVAVGTVVACVLSFEFGGRFVSSPHETAHVAVIGGPRIAEWPPPNGPFQLAFDRPLSETIAVLGSRVVGDGDCLAGQMSFVFSCEEPEASRPGR